MLIGEYSYTVQGEYDFGQIVMCTCSADSYQSRAEMCQTCSTIIALKNSEEAVNVEYVIA